MDTIKNLIMITRPLKDLPQEERKQILLELEVEDSKIVKVRHNISNQVVGHLRWHYGPVKKGGFHRDIVGHMEHPIKIKIRELKHEGKNSREVSSILGIGLDKINRIWASCELVKI